MPYQYDYMAPFQGGTAGALAGLSFGGPVGAAIGGGAGLLAGGLLGAFGRGKRRMYGPTEAQIANQAGAQRVANAKAQEQVFGAGLQRLASSAQGRGFGSSGAAAMGVPSLHAGLTLAGMQQEADLAQQANQMRASRSYDYEPGLAEQVMPGLMSAAGTAATLHTLGGLGQGARRSPYFRLSEQDWLGRSTNAYRGGQPINFGQARGF